MEEHYNKKCICFESGEDCKKIFFIAQDELAHRANMNKLAALGKWSEELEEKIVLANIQRVKQSPVYLLMKKNFLLFPKGVVIFLCAESGDSEINVKKMFQSIFNFKILEEDSNTMSASLKELEEDVLIVSQFTLAAITNKGPKAGFHKEMLKHPR